MPLTFHLIANAHLDPVWLWDWREGLNESLTTCRTVLDLMDEYPDLTFIRGEAAVYEHIERHDPATFARIAALVAAGRWEIVGGTYIQPDTNLPATETLCRHFLRGSRYFAARFGKRPRIAWAADSFGHSAGLPEILTAAGMDGFAFTRPSSIPLEKPAFWWEGPSGARVLAYRPPFGWYGTERDEIPRKLDDTLAAAGGGLQNVGVFFGVGNHGGGPTRRQIENIQTWAAAHPEVEVVFSGLHRLFAALRAEAAQNAADFLPTHRGELNFCLRGCYASAAKIKFSFRRAEAAAGRAETTVAAVSAALGSLSPMSSIPNLAEVWDAVLFNSFHDILPGSSIERAFEEQIDQMGGARHQCRIVEVSALNALAQRVDTQVPTPEGDRPSASAFLIWNPHLAAFHGPIELEACLDYRPLWQYSGRAEAVRLDIRGPEGERLPFQEIPTEHRFMAGLPWRKRAVVMQDLPPLGWSVVTVGWSEADDPQKIESPVAATGDSIENERFRVAARAGESGVQIFENGQPILTGAGLSAVTVEDPWGAWGSMDEAPNSLDLSEVRDRWKVAQVQTLEAGPERAALWVRLTGGNSRLDLTFSLSRGRAAIDVSARLFWNERGARLKLALPVNEAGERPEAEFDVPGARITRTPCGEVPGGRWASAPGPLGRIGFASDALYGFDAKDGQLRATIVRASPYASDMVSDGSEEPWHPVVDSGELRFRFLLTHARKGDDNQTLRRLAQELAQPPIVLLVPAKEGALPRSGSFGSLAPPTLELLALKQAEDGNGWIVRVQEMGGVPAEAQMQWQGQPLTLGHVAPNAIATWRLTGNEGGWTAARTEVTEEERPHHGTAPSSSK